LRPISKDIGHDFFCSCLIFQLERRNSKNSVSSSSLLMWIRDNILRPVRSRTVCFICFAEIILSTVWITKLVNSAPLTLLKSSFLKTTNLALIGRVTTRRKSTTALLWPLCLRPVDFPESTAGLWCQLFCVDQKTFHALRLSLSRRRDC
jgi:hypothetical protein